MPRSRKSQSKHDTEVREQAEKLQKQGFKVKADIKGFPKPETIGGLRPDVIATKPGQKKIIEVETPDSLGEARAAKQRQAFAEAADKSDAVNFTRKVTEE